jgi:hypothetical protein
MKSFFFPLYLSLSRDATSSEKDKEERTVESL